MSCLNVPTALSYATNTKIRTDSMNSIVRLEETVCQPRNVGLIDTRTKGLHCWTGKISFCPTQLALSRESAASQHGCRPSQHGRWQRLSLETSQLLAGVLQGTDFETAEPDVHGILLCSTRGEASPQSLQDLAITLCLLVRLPLL